MSTRRATRIATKLRMNEKLHVLQMADSGIVHQAVSN